MDRFSLFPNPSGTGYLLNVQSDLLHELNTRIVVPLLPLDQAPLPAKELNPVFSVDGKEHVMVTQYLAAIPIAELKKSVGDLQAHHNDIVAAIDLLLQGF